MCTKFDDPSFISFFYKKNEQRNVETDGAQWRSNVGVGKQ